MQKYPFVSEKL